MRTEVILRRRRCSEAVAANAAITGNWYLNVLHRCSEQCRAASQSLPTHRGQSHSLNRAMRQITRPRFFPRGLPLPVLTVGCPTSLQYGDGRRNSLASDGREVCMRMERDLLGDKAIPDDVYYGVQTARALENFHI